MILDPWEHVLGMGLGVVFVNQLVKWDAKLQVDLDKMLEKAKAANERRYMGEFFSLSTLRFILLFFILFLNPISVELVWVNIKRVRNLFDLNHKLIIRWFNNY